MNFMKKAMAKQVSRTRAAYENMLQMLAPYGKKELCRLMGIGYGGFFEDNCDLEISCPTLLIIGEKDITGKVKAYNKAWSKNTGFPLVTIPNAAHNSNIDNPKAVNKAIEEFIASIG
ncbi:MAG: alpha/beta hydrolase [Oscillospiraceae bacterium]|nr:alpha/beta hydrolase [Oscillospiraceae bacterium]